VSIIKYDKKFIENKSQLDHDFLYLFHATTRKVNSMQSFESRAFKYDRRERKGSLVYSLDTIRYLLHKGT